MKYLMIASLTLALVLAVRALYPEPSAVGKCRADAKLWENELIEHEGNLTNADSQWQSSDVGQVDLATWMDRQQQMGACLDIDGRQHEHYARVARRIDGVVSSRFLDYIVKTQQSRQYAEWEKQQQQVQKTDLSRSSPQQ